MASVTNATFQLTASRRGWQCGHQQLGNIEHFNSQPHEEADAGTTGDGTPEAVFQLTASRRGWLPDIPLSMYAPTFQLTASRRGWLGHPLQTNCAFSFQLTASRRGWRRIIECNFLSPIFQLTASRRGWPPKPLRSYLVLHFNSQPHEEADTVKILSYFGIFISTHSLTKRLTGSHKRHHWNYRHFNSQPHEEADLELQKQLSDVVVISTHSLTKRLTAILDKNTFI